MSTVAIPGAADHDVDLHIEEAAVRRALAVTPTDVEAAAELTYARNVFIPLTTACKYTCTYCTFYDPPGSAELLDPAAVASIVDRGVDAGCTEALFVLGDAPDDRYAELHTTLAGWGYDSVHDYLVAVCRETLDRGLLPHANPGDQSIDQLAALAPYNASMGVMLETTAEVTAHAGARGKSPGRRLATIRDAGRLGVPFTTGILVGIGEDARDRATSLLAIRQLHERYGHVQEVIVQPVVANERWRGGSPDRRTMRHAVAMARAVLPDDVAVQVPPNLAPVRELLDCGVEDLGGVSPVTVDHVNPAYAWPALEELRDIADAGGVPLRERLPIHHRFLPDLGGDSGDRFLRKPVRDALADDDEAGARYRRVIEGRNRDRS
ncbi:MAG: 7,8-didemethyl-8-hydroxy-5-deazariboflavin synthase subunit CofG [Halobacteriota archaeon]